MTKLPLLLAAIAATACSASAAENDKDRGPLGTVRWTIDEADNAKPGEVQLSFKTGTSRNNSNWSHSYGLADLPGLNWAALRASSDSPVRFQLNRAAGQLDCSGSAGSGEGVGTCAFAASAAFAQQLAARGIGQPTERQAYNLTLGNVGLDVLDELARHGYQKPDIDNLLKAWLDTFSGDDKYVYAVTAEKYWAEQGSIELRVAA